MMYSKDLAKIQKHLGVVIYESKDFTQRTLYITDGSATAYKRILKRRAHFTTSGAQIIRSDSHLKLPEDSPRYSRQYYGTWELDTINVAHSVDLKLKEYLRIKLGLEWSPFTREVDFR